MTRHSNNVTRGKWSHEELVRAMEANMHLHMTCFAKYVPAMTLWFEPDVTVIISEIPDDTFNYVIGAQFEEKAAEKRIAHVLKLYGNRPFSWWVSERDRPPSLPSLLEKAGLSQKEENIGMSLFLDSCSFERREGGIKIERVLEQKALKGFCEVIVSVGEYPQIYEQLFGKIPPVLYGEGAPLEIYVGSVNGVPIVTGILVLHANVGGIYYVMTQPDHRRRGYATEMMISLLLRAKERGYHMATLQASKSGKSLYQKLGFQPQCRFVEYAKA